MRRVLLLLLFIGCAAKPDAGGGLEISSNASTNLALNRPATASSVEVAGLEPGKAFDGSSSTRWSSTFSDAQWLAVDLGNTYNITGVRLTWEAAYASGYQIEVSADATTWTTVFTTTTGAGGIEDRTVTGTGRYVRVSCTKRGTQWGYSLWEVVVRGTSPQANLALNRPATTSSVEAAGLEAALAVDGSTTTRWSSMWSDPQWISVDLGATYSLSDVELRWEAAYASAYEIQLSTDGTAWTTAFSTTTGAGGIEDHPISGAARYVRVYGTKRATQWGYSLWEIAVHGASAGNAPTAMLAASPTTIASGQSSMLTWSSTNATSCSGSGFSASGTAGSASVHPTATTTYSITCTGAGGSASASATVTVSTGFALGQVPFASTSSWNRPIATGASFTPLGWPGSTGYNYGVNWDAYSPSVFIASANDPVVAVSYPAGWGYPGGTLHIRMPLSADGATGTDGELLVIADNVVHNFWQFHRTSSTTATAQSYGATNVLTGTGWGTRSPFLSAGITAAGTSMFAGLLVQAETDQGEINHALQLAADMAITRPGFVGEAIAGDGGASNGLFQEGQRLAIPPSTQMPSGLSPLGQKVFRAYVKYGAFVIDVAGGTTQLRAQANAYDDPTMTALWHDLGRITPLLEAVH